MFVWQCVNPYFKVVNNAATATAAQGAQMQSILDSTRIREWKRGKARGKKSSVVSWRHILIHASGANTHSMCPREVRRKKGSGAHLTRR